MTCENEDDPCVVSDLSAVHTAKVFLFLPDPQGTLDAGYNRIVIERSKKGVLGPFKQVSKVAKGMVIQPTVYNYVYIDEAADPSWFYKPVLLSSTDDDLEPIENAARPAVDTSFEAVMTIEELRRIYLTGIDLTDDTSAPFPAEMFAHYLRTAVSQVEMELDLQLLPEPIVERHDWYRRDYVNFAFLKLFQKPVVSAQKVSLEYPVDTNIITFPTEWIRLDRHAGHIQIMPARGNFSQSLVTQSGGYLPLILGGADFLPDLWKVEYTPGFDLGKLPPLIKEVVGLLAAKGALNLAGDLIGGPGIASKSVSIDGLSSSVSTTSSPSFAGYGARIKENTASLKEHMKTLQRYYHGGRISVTS